MLIILQKDIHMLNDESIDFLDAIGDVLTSNRLGKHLVLSDLETLNGLKQLNFNKAQKNQLTEISRTSQQILDRIAVEIDKCISIASYKGKHCGSLEEIPQDKLIDFALEDFIKYNLNQSVHLLAENLIDCGLFNLFCESYMQTTKLAKISKISNHCINGGGNNIDTIFFSNAKDNQPTICIKDGDIKEPPNENSFQVTDPGGNQSLKYSYLFQNHKLTVHEAENLVPLYILRLVLSQQQNQTFLSFLEKCHALNRDDILLYLDFKKGISNKNMRKLSEPYRNLIKAMLVDNNFAMAEQFSCLGGACKENECSENGKCSIIKGIQRNTLETCKKTMEEEDIINIYKGLTAAVSSTLTPLLEKIISLSLAARPTSTAS